MQNSKIIWKLGIRCFRKLGDVNVSIAKHTHPLNTIVRTQPKHIANREVPVATGVPTTLVLEKLRELTLT